MDLHIVIRCEKLITLFTIISVIHINLVVILLSIINKYSYNDFFLINLVEVVIINSFINYFKKNLTFTIELPEVSKIDNGLAQPIDLFIYKKILAIVRPIYLSNNILLAISAIISAILLLPYFS